MLNNTLNLKNTRTVIDAINRGDGQTVQHGLVALKHLTQLVMTSEEPPRGTFALARFMALYLTHEELMSLERMEEIIGLEHAARYIQRTLEDSGRYDTKVTQ